MLLKFPTSRLLLIWTECNNSFRFTDEFCQDKATKVDCRSADQSRCKEPTEHAQCRVEHKQYSSSCWEYEKFAWLQLMPRHLDIEYFKLSALEYEHQAAKSKPRFDGVRKLPAELVLLLSTTETLLLSGDDPFGILGKFQQLNCFARLSPTRVNRLMGPLDLDPEKEFFPSVNLHLPTRGLTSAENLDRQSWLVVSLSRFDFLF